MNRGTVTLKLLNDMRNLTHQLNGTACFSVICTIRVIIQIYTVCENISTCLRVECKVFFLPSVIKVMDADFFRAIIENGVNSLRHSVVTSYNTVPFNGFI